MATAVRRVGREGQILFVGPAQPYEMIRRQIALYHQTPGARARRPRRDGDRPGVLLCQQPRLRRWRRDGLPEEVRGLQRSRLQGTDPELTRKVTGDLETLMDETFNEEPPRVSRADCQIPGVRFHAYRAAAVLPGHAPAGCAGAYRPGGQGGVASGASALSWRSPAPGLVPMACGCANPLPAHRPSQS